MKQRHLRLLLAALFPVLIIPGFAQVAPDNPPLPDFDRRAVTAVPEPSAEQAAALTALRARVPGLKVGFEPVTGAPKIVSSTDGFLTGAAGQGKGVSATGLAAVPANDPNRITKAFLREQSQLFGHGPEALDQARIKREFVTPHNGLRTVVWEQQVDGIPVFDAVLVSHTTRNGELVSIASRFIPGPGQAANRFSASATRSSFLAAPPVSARQAVAIAAQDVGESGDVAALSAVGAAAPGPEQRQKFTANFLAGESEAKLIWLPMDRETLRPCWDMVLTSRTRGEMFRVLVDAQSGAVHVRRGLTDYLSDASYRVYTGDSPSPLSPGHPAPLTNQPPVGSRVLVTLSALDTNASPAGWLNDGDNETLGNNVDAHTDRDADNAPDLPRPQGSPFRVFDFPIDLSTDDPTNYSQAAVVQLFYWNNFMHDKLYALGFTEAAGNFQNTNFGRGGFETDAVQADAQDGSAFNNANFSSPPDGSPGRMQLFLFNGANPRRDADLDGEIVLHEYTHGLSNRRVGGGVGITALQSRGLGEGWSDFYSLAMLSESADDPDAVYAEGGYVAHQYNGLQQNYYFGIRRYPYCTDLNRNPLTLKDIDPGQFSSHPGIPRNAAVGGSPSEVHNQGEVWCVALWDARANLIHKYGWATGNQLILQLLTDAMNLTPANPNFIEARDAILQADLVNTGGTNRNELWAAFAKRGMGAGASTPVSSTTSGVVESFEVPDDLRVLPAAVFNSSGQAGGPFVPSCQSYSLTNTGSNTLSWVAYPTHPWLNVSPTNGMLSAGATGVVNVCLTGAANSLSVSSHRASVVFSNTTSTMRQTRDAALFVTPPRVYFFSLDTDPGWTVAGEWAFGVPDGLGGSHGRPDPAAGATGTNVFGINLEGDYSTAIGGPFHLTAGPLNFAGYTNVQLNFQQWLNSDFPPYVFQTIEVSSNGTSWSVVWTNGPFEVVDAAWSRQVYDLSAYADNRTNVYVRWGHAVAADAFAFSGWNLDDVEFDGYPITYLTLSIPSTATEGDGVLSGTVTVVPTATSNVVVTLNSGDPSEATVPPTVTILSGQSNAVFNLTIQDDADLDGGQLTTISAFATNYTGANSNLTVFDSEIATLQVILPATATEGQGTVQGTVQMSAVPNANITVGLSSTDTTEIQVPVSVSIPSGQTSAVFTATIVNDGLIDGPQSATVTAHVQNWTNGAAGITVFDNENTNLTVVLLSPINESAGTVTNAGRVSISGAVTTNVVVSLSSNPARLVVPGSVTILAGQTNGLFNLTAVDNAATDGSHIVLVTATAGGFSNGVGSVTMLEDDADHFTFAAIASPQTNLTPFSVTLTARDASNAVVVGFNKPVTLTGAGAQGSVVVAPTNTGPFTTGQWTGLVTVSTMDSNIVLTASDGFGHTGNSNPFNLVHPLSQFIPATNRVDMVEDTVRGLLYITTGTNVLRYDLNSRTFLSPFVLGTNLWGIDLSPDNNTLVVADAAYSATNIWAFVVDLPAGTNYQAMFPRLSGETGTYAVAFGADGAALITTRGAGSLLRYHPATQSLTTITNPAVDAVVSSSGDGSVAGLVDGGEMGRYEVASQTINGSAYVGGWTTFEVAADRQGSRFAALTYGGGYMIDTNLNQQMVLGTSASDGPIGAAYHPQADRLYLAWAASPFVRAYETHTMAELAEYDCDYTFVWNNSAFDQGRLRASRDGNRLFATVADGVRWFSFAPGPPANLALTQTAAPGFVAVDSNLTYTITISNLGPNTVTDARVFDRLPAGVTFISATSPQGACTQSNDLVTCTLAPLTNGTAATISIVVASPAPGLLINRAAVHSSAADPDPGNNASTLSTIVSFPLDHFEWNFIPSPQFAGAPFLVTVLAKDEWNVTITNWPGPVMLSSTNGTPVNPAVSGSFAGGAWNGWLSVPQAVSNLVLRAADGAGHVGLANQIDVVNLPGLKVELTNGTVSLAWPAASEYLNFVLETSPTLSPPAWVTVPDPPTQVDDEYVVSLSVSGTNAFYRLHYQP